MEAKKFINNPETKAAIVEMDCTRYIVTAVNIHKTTWVISCPTVKVCFETTSSFIKKDGCYYSLLDRAISFADARNISHIIKAMFHADKQIKKGVNNFGNG